MARELTKAIYTITCTGKLAKDFGLKDQLRRAAVSVMSNIAEGFGRKGNKEFLHFLSIARGSVSEVRSLLYVALDSKLIDSELFDSLLQQAERTASVVAGFMRYLASRQVS